MVNLLLFLPPSNCFATFADGVIIQLLKFRKACIFHRGHKAFCLASKQIIKQSKGVNKLEKCFFNLFILIVCRIFFGFLAFSKNMNAALTPDNRLMNFINKKLISFMELTHEIQVR